MRHTIKDVETLNNLMPTLQGRDFAFDVETTGTKFRKDRLLGLALTFNDDHYYIVIEHTVEDWVGNTFLRQFIDRNDFANAVRGLFAQRDVVMVAHNAKFDLHFLTKLGLSVEGKLFDTMIAARLIDENRRLGLKELASLIGMELTEYSELPHYPGFGKKDILGVSLPNVAYYAMNDTEATWRLYEKFRVQLVEEKVEHAFRTIWMPLLVVLQQMEAAGIALDLDKVRELMVEYKAKAERHENMIVAAGREMLAEADPETLPSYYIRTATAAEIEGIYEDMNGRLVTESDGHVLPVNIPTGKRGQALKPRVLTFNLGSPKQLGDLVYKHLKVDTTKGIRLKTNDDGTFKVDKDNLETLNFYLGDDAPPILKEIVEWRKATKFISTYLERFLEDADPDDFNSITTNFNQAGETDKGGTRTGRLSSNEPNLQNIPSRGEVGKASRSLFLAREGHALLVGDYAQMELRMLAHFSQDPDLAQAFVEEKDLHILTGAAFARLDYEELKARYDAGDREAWEFRQLGKTGNFALTYGMGPRKFQRYLIVNNQYEISIEEAGEWINQYNKMFPRANKWKDEVRAEVRRNGYVKTLAHCKRRLPDIHSQDQYVRFHAERQAINAIIQGSCGDVMGKVMPYVQAAIAPFGATLLLQVHDELVAEAPLEHAQTCTNIMQQLMMDVPNPKLRIPMKAEVHQGPSWGAAKS
jgi:DNA polymerase-1